MLLPSLGTPRPLPEAVIAGRAIVTGALSSLLAVPDNSLERAWPWRGDDADVRYGLYRLHELFDEAAAAVVQDGAATTRAGLVLGQATAARWELHGLLLPLADLLDRDPGGGEWSIRSTLAHIVSTQASYSVRTAYAVHRHRRDPALPVILSDRAAPRLAPEEAGGGDLAEVGRRLDDWLDTGIGWLVDVDDDEALAAPTTWSGYPVDARFRLHRWSSHLREHTIHLEKTLVTLGRSASEVERVLRIVAAAYGRLEGELTARPGADPAPLVRAAEAVRTHAAEILAAA